MFRGTTPTFVITLPDIVSVSDIDVAYLTFEQFNKKVFEKSLEDMIVDGENNTLTINLTQQETLLLVPKMMVRYQLRFGIGENYYATQIWDELAERILKDGEI